MPSYEERTIQMEVILKASLGNTYYGESGISQNMLSSDSPNRLKLGHSLCFPTPLYLYKVGNPPSRSFDVLQGSLHRRPIAVQYRRRRFIGQDVLNRATFPQESKWTSTQRKGRDSPAGPYYPW
jgi:hypothetical protein